MGEQQHCADCRFLDRERFLCDRIGDGKPVDAALARLCKQTGWKERRWSSVSRKFLTGNYEKRHPGAE